MTTGPIPAKAKTIRKRALKRCARRKIKPEQARGWLRRQLRGQ